MNITVRDAEKCDYEAIAGLMKHELGYKELDNKQFFDRLDFMRSNDLHRVFVADYNGQTIGFLGLFRAIQYELNGEYIRMAAFAVSEAYQKNGIGEALLNAALDYGRQLGIKRVELDSGLLRKETHTFYKNKGFKEWAYSFRIDL